MQWLIEKSTFVCKKGHVNQDKAFDLENQIILIEGFKLIVWKWENDKQEMARQTFNSIAKQSLKKWKDMIWYYY